MELRWLRAAKWELSTPSIFRIISSNCSSCSGTGELRDCGRGFDSVADATTKAATWTYPCAVAQSSDHSGSSSSSGGIIIIIIGIDGVVGALALSMEMLLMLGQRLAFVFCALCALRWRHVSVRYTPADDRLQLEFEFCSHFRSIEMGLKIATPPQALFGFRLPETQNRRASGQLSH